MKDRIKEVIEYLSKRYQSPEIDTALAALRFSQWVINEYDNSSSPYVLEKKFTSCLKG